MKAKIYGVSKTENDILPLEKIKIVTSIEEGKTVIDGGTILTDSVNAKSIAANAITTNKLAADSITGEKIKANTIDVNKLKTHQIVLPNTNYGGVKITDEGMIAESKGNKIILSSDVGLLVQNKKTNKDVLSLDATTGEVSLDVAKLSISSNSVATENYVQDKSDSAVSESKKHTDEQIESININERNLLKDTSEDWTEITFKDFTPSSIVYKPEQIGLSIGDPIVYSMEIDNSIDKSNTSGSRVAIDFFDSNNALLDTMLGTVIKAGEKDKSVGKKEIPNNTSYMKIHDAYKAETGKTKTLAVRRQKLQRGKYATDWTPAPEDARDYADSVSDKAQDKALKESKTYTDNKIEISEDGITLGYKEYTDNKVESLDINDKNLFLGSYNEWLTKTFKNYTDGNHHIKLEDVGLNQGDTITFSIDIDNSIDKENKDEARAVFNFYDKSGNRISSTSSYIPLPSVEYGQVERISRTEIIPEGTYDIQIFDFSKTEDEKEKTFAIRRQKLQRGNRATDWTPAYQDTIQESVNQAVEYTDSEIKTAKDGIKLEYKSYTDDEVNKVKEQNKKDINLTNKAVEEAKSSAQEANKSIADMAKDTNLSQVEKKTLQKDWDIIQSEYPKLKIQGQKYDVNTTDYIDSYSSLESYIEPILKDKNQDTTIVPSTFKKKFTNYYDEKLSLMNLVNDKVKELGDKAVEEAYDYVDSQIKLTKDGISLDYKNYTDGKIEDSEERNKKTVTELEKSITQAKTSADSANKSIADMAKDTILSPIEKTSLAKEWEAIQSEYPKLKAQAKKYEVSDKKLNAKYSSLKEYITPLLKEVDKDSTIKPTSFKQVFKDYYDEKLDIMNLINDRIKELGDIAVGEAYEYVDSQIDMTKEGIVLGYKKYTDDKVDAVEPGSKNLLLGSDTYDKSGVSSNNAKKYPIFKEELEEDKEKFVRVKRNLNEGDQVRFSIYNSLKSKHLSTSIKGKEIIMSTKVRASEPAQFNLMSSTSEGGLSDSRKLVDVDTEWKTISSAPFIAGDVEFLRFTPMTLQQYKDHDLNDFYLDLGRFWITEGNKAPKDWIPAPEDISKDAVSSAKNYTDSQIKLSEDGIKLGYKQYTDNKVSSSEKKTNNTINGIQSSGENLIQNGNFENGFTGWDPAASASLTNNGRTSGKAVRMRRGSTKLITNIPVEPGRTYEYGYWYRTSSDFDGAVDNTKMRLGAPGGGLINSKSYTGNTTEWKKLTRTTKIKSEDIYSLKISIVSAGSKGWIDFSEVYLIDITRYNETESSAKKYTDSQIDITKEGIVLGYKNYTDEKVDNQKAGGRNLLLKTDNLWADKESKDFKTPPYKDLTPGIYVLSADIEIVNAHPKPGSQNSRLGLEFKVGYESEKAEWLNSFYYPKEGENYKGRIHSIIEIKDTITWIGQKGLFANQIEGDIVRVGLPKLERGNVPTDWSPAPEDLIKEATSQSKDYTDSEISLTKEGIELGYKNYTDNAVEDIDINERNYFSPSKVNNLAFKGSGDSGEILERSDYRGYSLPVSVGEIYSISRSSKTNNRFRIAYTSSEPKDGMVYFGSTSDKYDNALKAEGLLVPEDAEYMVVYLSNKKDELPNIKIQKGYKATDWTPAPEDLVEEATNESKKYTDSQIKLSEDGISLGYKKYTDDKVGNLDISDRNLLKGTSDEWEEITIPKNAYGTRIKYFSLEELSLKPGDSVTLSEEIDNTIDDFDTGVYIFIGAPREDKQSYIVKADSKQVKLGDSKTVSVTITIPEKATEIAIRRARNDKSANKVVNIKRQKLNRGTRATPWTPAPEDLVKEATNESKKYTDSQIKLSEDGISLGYKNYTDGKIKDVEEQNKKTVTELEKSITQAKTSADSANQSIADMAKDTILSPLEKPSLAKEWETIQSEYPKLKAQAKKYGVSDTKLDAKYSSLKEYITPLLKEMDKDSTIKPTSFKQTFKEYYDEKLDIMNLINDRIKELGDIAVGEAYEYVDSQIDMTKDGIKLSVEETKEYADSSSNKAEQNAKDYSDTEIAKVGKRVQQAEDQIDESNKILVDMSKDDVLSPIDKKSLSKEWEQIQSEYPKLIEQGNKYGTNVRDIEASYSALEGYLIPILSQMGENTEINSKEFRSKFKEYYGDKLTLMNSVSDEVRKLGDAAASDAENRAKVYTDSQIDITKDGIKLGYKQYTDDKVGNLDINDRNLLLNSSNPLSRWRDYKGSAFNTKQVDMTEEWGTENAYEFSISGGTNRLKVFYTTTGRVSEPMVFDQEYTYSIFIKNTGKNKFQFHINGLRKTENSGTMSIQIEPGESKHLSFTGVRRDNYDWFQPMVRTRNDYVDDDLKVIMAMEKIQKGNKATDWTPAPEDIINESVNKSSSYTDSQIKLAEEGITLGYKNYTDESSQKVKDNAKSYADNAVDNININDRNLLQDSANKKTGKLHKENPSQAEYDTLNVGRAFDNIEDKTEITISFDIETTELGIDNLRIYNTNNKGPMQISSRDIQKIPAGTTRQNVTTVVNSRGNDVDKDDSYIEFYTKYGTGHLFEITNVKIQRGNRATGWSPAPEDIVEEATNESKKYTDSQIKLSEDGVSLGYKKYTDDQLSNQEIGGTNLLLDSDRNIKMSSSSSVTYDMSEKMEEITYTLTLKGKLGKGKSSFKVYISDGYRYVGGLKSKGNNIYQGTFEGRTDAERLKKLIIYALPNSVKTESEIEWAKLEKGNTATDWSPAPYDIESSSISSSKKYTDSQIKLSEDGIKLGYKKYTDNRVDNIDINDRNILLDSKKRTIDPSPTNNFNYLTYEFSDTNLTKGNFVLSGKIKPLGKEFDKFRAYFRGKDENGKAYGVETIYPSIDENGRFSSAVKSSSIRDEAVHVLLYAGMSGDTAEQGAVLTDIKLQEGNRATAWTPAPEDIDTKIDNIQGSGKNVLQNGSFENGIRGWKYPDGNNYSESIYIVSEGHSGKAIHLDSINKVQNIETPANIPVEPGQRYEISYWYRTSNNFDGTTSNTKIRLARKSNSLISSKPFDTIGGTWKKTSHIGTIPKDVYEMKVTVNSDGKNGWIEYDDIQVVNIDDIENAITESKKYTDGQIKIAEEGIILDYKKYADDSIEKLDINDRNLIVANNLKAHPYFTTTPKVEKGGRKVWVKWKTHPGNLIAINVGGFRPEGLYTLSARIEINGKPVTSNRFPSKKIHSSHQDSQNKRFDISDDGRLIATEQFNGNDNGCIFHTYMNDMNEGDIVTFYDFKFQKGNKATDWTPAPEDLVEEATNESKKYTDNQISITEEGIKSKVDKDGVISQINQSSEGVLIDGAKHHITGKTKIDNAVITSAMIKDIDASRVTVSANSGKKSVKMTKDGFIGYDDNGKLRLLIGVQDLAGDGKSDPSNVVFYSGNGKKSVSVGTNVDDTFVIGSENSGVNGLVRIPKQLTLESDDVIVMGGTNKSDYGDYWRFGTSTVGGKKHVVMTTDRPYAGVLGHSHRFLRKIYTTDADIRRLDVGYGFNNPQEGDFSVRKDSRSGFIMSKVTTTTRTYDVPANVRITRNGVFGKAISASKYKLNIQNLKQEEALDLGNRLLTLNPSKWWSKDGTEGYVSELDGDDDFVDENNVSPYYGMVAEDLRDVGLDPYIEHDEKTGEIEGIQYDRLWTPLIPIIREQRAEIEKLKIEVEKLKRGGDA